MQAFARPPQNFQPVSRRDREIGENCRGVQLIQLAESHRLQARPSPASSGDEETVRLRALERLDNNVDNITRSVTRQPGSSIGRRLFHAADDEDLDGRFGTAQMETGLILESGE
jgi:hypothetical protein